MNNKLWFKRKLYGWGWTPVTWEGWLVIFIYIALLYVTTTNMEHEGIKNIAVIVMMTVVLLYVCYKKGEKPRWQWGKRIED